MLSIHLMGITDVVLSCPTIDCSDDEVGMASERELCAKMVADLEGAVGLDFGLSNLSYSRLRIHDAFFTLPCYCSGLSFSCCFANGRLEYLLLCDARTDVLTGWVKRVIIALALGYITLANFHLRKAPFPTQSPQLGPRSTLTRILEQPSQALGPPASDTTGSKEYCLQSGCARHCDRQSSKESIFASSLSLKFSQLSRGYII
jgi:hypothetical protein